jgi:hypothetical protein
MPPDERQVASGTRARITGLMSRAREKATTANNMQVKMSSTTRTSSQQCVYYLRIFVYFYPGPLVKYKRMFSRWLRAQSFSSLLCFADRAASSFFIFLRALFSISDLNRIGSFHFVTTAIH